jgi:hypothetical protein
MNEQRLLILVEDEPDEVFLFQRAVRKLCLPNPLLVLPTVGDLRKYLEGKDIYQNRDVFPLPCLVLLDIDSKLSNAEDFLDWLRNQSPCRDLLVAGLSDVEDEKRKQKLFDRGLNAMYVKRLNVTETLQLVQDLELVDDALQTEEERRRGSRKAC